MTSFSLPECHNQLRRSWTYRALILQSIRKADLVNVPSQATREAILEWLPDLDSDRVRVIPPGLGAEFKLYPEDEVKNRVASLSLPSDYILYVGTIEPRKNLQRLVTSYQNLVQAGITEHLVLVGKLGWGYEELLKQIQAPELRDKVHLLGYVEQHQLPWIYAGAKLFVYPSLQEGFGFPPLEAMACGVPTITSKSSSLTEYYSSAAELVCPNDIAALTSAMKRLLEDQELRWQRRQQGLNLAAQFNWQETARQTLNCYQQLVQPSA